MSNWLVSEECVCGTTFKVEGSASFSAARYEEYLKNHKVCLNTRQIEMSTKKKEPKDDYDELTSIIRKQIIEIELISLDARLKDAIRGDETFNAKYHSPLTIEIKLLRAQIEGLEKERNRIE